ncbi:MAG: FG-GAP-like repeat-containing protein [Saprospiraceae bacterium]|nr:FG-GAP-like repeat-containing protein [Saprospiraceae bacterium]
MTIKGLNEFFRLNYNLYLSFLKGNQYLERHWTCSEIRIIFLKEKAPIMIIKTTKKVFLIFFLISPFFLQSQQFELASGVITSKLSDSRSVNFFDLNNDGWEDIYISNGLSGGQPDLFYLNDGTGQFTEVTDMETLQASNPSDGASFVDYNNDGHIDGVISSWYGAEDLLYLNDGNGNLNYNSNAGIATGSFAETATFGDYDNDGWLDLYITNSGGNNKNYLYKNLKNGKFERITNHVLVNDVKLSRGAIWGDFNNDEITDLFVANENETSNDIFYGIGGGDFEKLTSGAIVSTQKSSMTGSWGDIDNDGDFDLFVGNSLYFQQQRNQLYLNQGDEFEVVTNGPIVTDEKCTYGSAFGDYDNDGDLDLIIANGFCNLGLENTLYENQGDGSFIDASGQLASNFTFCSFGVAWGDVNNDGFLDLMVANCKNNSSNGQKANSLLLNKGNDHNWLKIKLIGIQSNKNAIGAKVKIKATIEGKEVWQTREIRSQSGYAGQNSMIVHFGLGNAENVDSLIINWPAGGTQIFENIEARQLLTISEDMTNNVSKTEKRSGISFELYPNPVSKDKAEFWLNIQNDSELKNGELILFDSLGRTLLTQTIQVLKGESKVSIPIRSQKLPSGIYQAVIQIGLDKISRKIIVK